MTDKKNEQLKFIIIYRKTNFIFLIEFILYLLKVLCDLLQHYFSNTIIQNMYAYK